MLKIVNRKNYEATICITNAIDRCREYNLAIPEEVLHIYQRYILYEVAKGKRRGGTKYSEMNIYRYAGIDKSIKQFKKEIEPKWAVWINKWILYLGRMIGIFEKRSLYHQTT